MVRQVASITFGDAILNGRDEAFFIPKTLVDGLVRQILRGPPRGRGKVIQPICDVGMQGNVHAARLKGT